MESQIENWEDRILFQLADPISECNNQSFDGNLVYCKIYLQINYELEYFIGDLASFVRSISKKKPDEFYNRILAKTKRLNMQYGYRYDYTILQIEEYLKSI